jgi:hypothetical protein
MLNRNGKKRVRKSRLEIKSEKKRTRKSKQAKFDRKPTIKNG